MCSLRERKALSDSVRSGWYDQYSQTSSGGEGMFAEVYKNHTRAAEVRSSRCIQLFQ